jgi:predicted acetyltransferase
VIEVGGVADDEREAFVNAFGAAFSHVFKQELVDELLQLFDADVYRPFAARSDGKIVGTALDMALDLTVAEGAIVPCRGITWVSVLPTHRRRGVMRALMAEHDAECRRQGVAASLLHSSQSGLYAGYGVATRRARVTVATPHTAFLEPPPEIELRLADAAGSLAACQAVWDRCRLQTPGFTTRPDPEIAYVLKDLEGFCVFAGDDGYMLYTVDRRWTGPNAEFQIKVQELMAATREAYAALWQYVCGLTHVVEVVANLRPVDEPLQHMVRQPRRVDISHANDGVWLKPYDRAALCAARGRADPGEAVSDEAFANLLLGAFTPASLVRAGRIPEGVASDWVSPTVPWSPLEF